VARVHRLFLPPERLTGERVALDDEPHRYLTRVLRLGPGDALVVFDGQGGEIDARIEAATGRGTTLLLGARRTVAPPPRRLALMQAVPRGERMDLVVQKTTELGLGRLLPVWTARTVVQGPHGDDDADGGARLRRWRKIAQEAARQCGRADLPVIEPPRALTAALAALGEQATDERATDERAPGERAPGEQAPPPGLRLLLWEGAQASGAAAVPLRQALADAAAHPTVTLLVGPEGGFAPDEAEAARAAGFLPVGLGPLVLRSETAALVAVALAQSALGALD
jgi:16S rRNA (uracil1498-N3)-methyltransferase